MIDWDKIAGDAESTPAAVLAEFLAMADEIETLVVIANKWNPEEGDEWKYATSGSGVKALGLIQAAHRSLDKWVANE